MTKKEKLECTVDSLVFLYGGKIYDRRRKDVSR